MNRAKDRLARPFVFQRLESSKPWKKYNDARYSLFEQEKHTDGNDTLRDWSDYTPAIFRHPQGEGFTHSIQLASAMMFTSPLLCWADHP